MEARHDATLAFNDDNYNVKFVKKGFEGGHQRYLLTMEGPGLKRLKIIRTVDLAALERVLAAVPTMPAFRGSKDTSPCNWPHMRWLVAKVNEELKKNKGTRAEDGQQKVMAASSANMESACEDRTCAPLARTEEPSLCSPRHPLPGARLHAKNRPESAI